MWWWKCSKCGVERPWIKDMSDGAKCHKCGEALCRPVNDCELGRHKFYNKTPPPFAPRGAELFRQVPVVCAVCHITATIDESLDPASPFFDKNLITYLDMELAKHAPIAVDLAGPCGPRPIYPGDPEDRR